jgi:hypothetical protein
MKLSMTGVGGLPCKLFTSILMVLSFGVFAADNSIYIDQMGDSSTVTIIQDGAGNTVRGLQGVGTSNATPAKIYGDGTLVSVSQIGSGSILNLAMVSTIASGAGGGTSVIYSVTGNNATATINSNGDGQGISASNTIGVNQTGNNASANVNVLGTLNNLSVTTAGGSNNSVTATQNGDNNNTTISNTGGGGNTTTTDQQGNNNMISLTTVGASNTTNIAQTGGSVSGHQATVEIIGSGNNTGITQAGTSGDSIVNLKSVGSTNTITINTNTY